MHAYLINVRTGSACVSALVACRDARSRPRLTRYRAGRNFKRPWAMAGAWLGFGSTQLCYFRRMSDPRPAYPFDIGAPVRCPFKDCGGEVRISHVISGGERHIHWHCTCCRHVWMERERRPEDLPYRPPMSK